MRIVFPAERTCQSWVGLDSVRYGGLPVDELVLEVEVGTGKKARSVRDPGLRAVMYRVDK